MNNFNSSPFATPPGFSDSLGIRCSGCNCLNDFSAKRCGSCGAPLSLIDVKEGPSLSSFANFGAERQEALEEGMEKVPLEEAKNLLLLRESVDKLARGEMPLKEYRANVDKVFGVIRGMVEMLKSPATQSQLAQLPEDQREFARQSLDLFEELQSGCLTLLQYNGGPDTSLVEEGLSFIEDIFAELDDAHDIAMEIAVEEEQDIEEYDDEEGGSALEIDNL